jgi:hypothetical protein
VQTTHESHSHDNENIPTPSTRAISPFPLTIGITCMLLLLVMILPLHGLWFMTASLPAGLQQVVLLPVRTLFPAWSITPTLIGQKNTAPPISISWLTVVILIGVFALLHCFYLLALRWLPQSISRRSIILSTLLFGLICTCIPIITSQDIFSYIGYARIGILYHLNPLTTTPLAIPHDPVFPLIYWKNQPSAYGPTWIGFLCLLQWLTTPFGTTTVAPMVLALRLSGLLAHLCSSGLIWIISGRLLPDNAANTKRRMRAMLTFAWNPLLLFEACTNAHVDTFLLLALLTLLWCFVYAIQEHNRCALLATTILFALGTCLKVNLVLLFPALLLYLWSQTTPSTSIMHRIKPLILLCALYLGIILLLYLPFWQHGALLNLLTVNPGASRNINNYAEFLTHFINGVSPWLGAPQVSDLYSPLEIALHTISLILFSVSYLVLIARSIWPRYQLQSPLQIIRWMAQAWLLYCFIGAPWFWPWYLITFFGLFALLEATSTPLFKTWTTAQNEARIVHLLSFSMLSLYSFYAYAPYATMAPLLIRFRWAYIRGIWAWCIPMFAYKRGARKPEAL